MLEKGKELIKEEKYIEAYECFKNEYEKTKNTEAYYYMITIDYFHIGDKSLEEYYRLFKNLYKLAGKKYLPAYINPLASIAFNLKDYKFCFSLLEKGMKYKLLDGYLTYLYASCIWQLEKNIEKAESFLTNIIENNVDDDSVLGACYELKALMYAEKYGYDEALRVIQHMYVSLESKDLIDYTELKVLFKLNDDKLIEEFLDRIKEYKSKEALSFCYNQVVEFYEKQNNFVMVLKYIKTVVEEFLDFYTSKDFVYNYYATILLNLEKYDELEDVIRLINLDNCDLEQWSNVMYKYFSLAVHKMNYKEAEEIAIECFEKSKDQEWFFLLTDLYIFIGEYKKSLSLLQDITKKNDVKVDLNRLNYNYLRTYRYLGEYDLAVKYGKDVREFNNGYALLRHKMAVDTNPKKYYKKLFNKCINENDSVCYYGLSNMYFHGDNGVKPSSELALKYISKAILIEKDDNCVNSLLGNIYLENNEIDKAVQLFKNAKDVYQPNKDCPCCVVFYCYVLSKGIGVNKNEEEAFEILDNIVSNHVEDINETGIGLYAMLGIKLNKDLNKILSYVEKVHERRYSTIVYFVKVKLKKSLNIDYKDDLKMFKKSLKYASLKEKIHYKKNNDEIYMNNF